MSAFRTQRPLRFGDCDASGIAYFPAYFNLLVGVVEEFFASIGMPWRTMIQDRRIGVPTVKLDVTFSAPSMYGDMLDWELKVLTMGRSSLTVQHVISRDGTRLWDATQVLVATTLDSHKAIAWPDDIRAMLNRHLTP
jgi:4-hydroxybenzoyl-CoA thioesterase